MPKKQHESQQPRHSHHPAVEDKECQSINLMSSPFVLPAGFRWRNECLSSVGPCRLHELAPRKCLSMASAAQARYVLISAKRD